MPTEEHTAFQGDSLSAENASLPSDHNPIYSDSAAHEETDNESISHAGRPHDSGTDNSALTTDEQQSSEPAPYPHEEPARPDVSRPFTVEHNIESGAGNGQAAPEKHELRNTPARSMDAPSVQLTGTAATEGEKRRQPLPLNQKTKQAGVSASSDNLPEQAPWQEITHPSSSETGTSSRPPASPHDNNQAFFNATLNAATEESTERKQHPPIAQTRIAERKNNNGERDSPPAKTHNHQEAITTDSRRDAFPAKASPVSRHVLQQPARKPESPFIAPAPIAKAAEVKIGQVDVFIETPRKETGAAGNTRRIPQTFSSRHYLRRI